MTDRPRFPGGSGEWFLPEGAVEPLWLPGDSVDFPGGCHYDPSMVDAFVEFCREFLRFPQGHLHGRDIAGRPVEWAQWQMDRLVRPIFGVKTAHGARATSMVFYLSARGTGKTTYAAAMGLFGLCAMGVANPEVDLFAVSREQAARMFDCAARFVRANEWLSDLLTVHDSRKRISNWSNGGELVVRSGDAEAELGLNPSMVLFDELLAQKNRGLWDAVVTAMGKRAEDLLMVMTTPSTKVESFARQVYERAKRVEADRSLEPYFLPVIYESEPDDDPWSEDTWKKACPALGTGFMNPAKYRAEAAVAKLDAVERHNFRVFRLAQWTQAGGGFINLSSWDDNIKKVPVVGRLAGNALLLRVGHGRHNRPGISGDSVVGQGVFGGLGAVEALVDAGNVGTVELVDFRRLAGVGRVRGGETDRGPREVDTLRRSGPAGTAGLRHVPPGGHRHRLVPSEGHEPQAGGGTGDASSTVEPVGEEHARGY